MPRIHYKQFEGITSLARGLRKNMTPSEKVLWEILRKRRVFGYKFLRQHPIFYHIDRNWVDFYIADFYCAELKLIIEADGPIHQDQIEYDQERDAKLLNKGMRVIRLMNKEIDAMDPDGRLIMAIVGEIIKQKAENKSPDAPSLVV